MHKLAAVAIEAVNNPRARARSNQQEIPFDTGKGLCQKFVRICLIACYGTAFSERYRAASAKIAARIWLHADYGFPASELSAKGGLQEGDILYKTTGSGGFGHVGIYVGNDRVAENSSTKIGRVRGALGFRTLAQYGRYDVVVRLPIPK